MGLPLAIALNRFYSLTGFEISNENKEIALHNGINTSEIPHDFKINNKAIRIFWLMLPAGEPTNKVLSQIENSLNPGDIIIESGNSSPKDTRERSEKFSSKKVAFVSIGISGGVQRVSNDPPIVWGSNNEECNKYVSELIEKISCNHFYVNSPELADHVKVIHNAIEYGMMQSIADGVALYESYNFSEEEILKILKLWSNGSIIESRLLNCIIKGIEEIGLRPYKKIAKSETLTKVKATVESSKFILPAIKSSVEARENLNILPESSHSALALMRKMFGNHDLK